jgi:hypothetical protein
MNRPRLIRGLRIAWSVWWGILCVLLVVLWVRSYSMIDNLYCNAPGCCRITGLSFEGSLMLIIRVGADANDGWRFSVNRLGGVAGRLPEGFELEVDDLGIVSGAPHWFAVVVTAVLATATSITQIKRSFSLRTLLIATTLIAVVLGVVVWSSS